MRRLTSVCAILFSLVSTSLIAVETKTVETVYVETDLDTDRDGLNDRIYVRIDRPSGASNVPSIITMSPYALGGNNTPYHNVNVTRLPQDTENSTEVSATPSARHKAMILENMFMTREAATQRGYASISAHSLGTGYSRGCPTVGDESETLATKAVIDWLNGRAKAYSSANGTSEVRATWASGAVGMTGVSYNGTLPNMVATTGVDGLKAIVPVAAISDWYDYYRANGLVVGPGGYVGEDADILGKYIVRNGACSSQISELNRRMGREHGDFTPFWEARDYVSQASGVRAAVFIIHGQSDWNVRQRHAIRWWEALHGNVPLKMWLHKGGHSNASRADTSAQVWRWFDRYVKGIDNDIENEPAIEVESSNGTWTAQASWPHEATSTKRLFLNSEYQLSESAGIETSKSFTDAGKTSRFESMLANPTSDHANRLAFVTVPLSGNVILSGTPRIHLDLAVMNRRAANLSVAVIEYSQSGQSKIVTRGWADPQNHSNRKEGELLIQGQRYQVSFELEPKQYTFSKGSKIGVAVTASDYEHTLRPDNGTKITVNLGSHSFIDLNLSN